jgi:GT2 family glycosyltransferase
VKRPAASVVICTHSEQRWDSLLAAVESLRLQKLRPRELIVVVDDNAALAARVRAHIRDAVVVENAGSHGLSSARNAGIAVARGDVIAFLDDDAVAEPEWLATLLACYSDPSVIGVGGSVEPLWEHGRPRWFPQEFDWVVGCSYRGLPRHPSAVRNFIGANMSFRRTVFGAVGDFTPSLGRVGDRPLGCEETEMCIRALQNWPGSTLRYEPRARVRHQVPASRGRLRYFVRRCFLEGRSKAVVVQLRGGAGLATERRYVLRVLSSGIGAAVAQALTSRRATSLERGGVIALGLATTSAGYLIGRYASAGNIVKHRLGAVGSAAGVQVLGGAEQALHRARRLAPMAPVAPVLIGCVFWMVSLRGLDLRGMNDMGLVSVLPPSFFVALAFITAGFLAALFASRVREAVLAAHATAFVLFVHGTPAVAYGTLRYAWAWKHVGIVDYIERHGTVNPDISWLSAYHNWPGFFSLATLLTELGGWKDAAGVAAWAPVFFELIFAGAVLLLAKALTDDTRLAWLATWLFLVSNWIAQDYFSPQALCFFLFVVVLALSLRYFGVPVTVASTAATHSVPAEGAVGTSQRVVLGRGERVALLIVLVLAITFVVSSHQLTPFMLVLALGALVTFGRLELHLLPVLAAVLTLGWITFMCVGFLEGNLYWVVDSIGSLQGNANATLINLASASSGMRHVALVDRALTLFVAALALIGIVRRVRTGSLDLSAILLAAVPFVMLGANAYGNEMLFRVYFFSLPAMAFLAAAAFLPTPASWNTRFAPTFVVGASVLLLTGFCIAYYGKERLNYFTKDEVRAARLLYSSAEPGSLLLSGTYDSPWAFDHYERYRYIALSQETSAIRRRALAHPVETLLDLVEASQARHAYFTVTRSQRAEIDMTGVMPRGSLAAIERAVERSPRFRSVYRGRDASILEVVEGKR